MCIAVFKTKSAAFCENLWYKDTCKEVDVQEMKFLYVCPNTFCLNSMIRDYSYVYKFLSIRRAVPRNVAVSSSRCSVVLRTGLMPRSGRRDFPLLPVHYKTFYQESQFPIHFLMFFSHIAIHTLHLISRKMVSVDLHSGFTRPMRRFHLHIACSFQF